MIPANDHWGPFVPDLDPAERLARLRAMQALVRVLVGPKGAQVVEALRAAEVNDNAAVDALRQFDALPALARRRVLATYAELHRPIPTK